MNANSEVTGWVDSVYEQGGKQFIKGWACELGVNSAVSISLFGKNVSGENGAYSEIASDYTEPGLHDICNTAGYVQHRFNIEIPKGVLQQHAAEPITVKARSHVSGTVGELGGGQSFTFPIPTPEVGMLYFFLQGLATENYNLEKILSGEETDSPEYAFHWWGEPVLGFYNLAEDVKAIENNGGNIFKDSVLAKHAYALMQLKVDFVLVDMSNYPTILDEFTRLTPQNESVVLKTGVDKGLMEPFEAMLRVWSNIEGAPKIVPWVPFQSTVQSSGEQWAPIEDSDGTLSYAAEKLRTEYPEMRYFYKGSPLLISSADARYPSRSIKHDEYTQDNDGDGKPDWVVRETWNSTFAAPHTSKGFWPFLDECDNHIEFLESAGRTDCVQSVPVNVEQMSVATAYQRAHMSSLPMVDGVSTMPVRKMHGRTFVKQFKSAFEHKPQIVLITGWNEWVSQRQPQSLENPVCESFGCFTDQYDAERNRDIEPGGPTKDYYYRLADQLISDFKAGKAFDEGNYLLTEKTLFDYKYYADTYNDLKSAFGDNENALYLHWQQFGKMEGRSPSFAYKPGIYRCKNPELGFLDELGLLAHFVNDGLYEGRIASDLFHSASYLNRHSDLLAAYGEMGGYIAWRHWLFYGQYEGSRYPAPPLAALDNCSE